MESRAGRRWAYFGVILGFSASVTANIASTVLQVTDISLWLRVPFAIFWPLATYVAIEVLVRTNWRRSWAHNLVRLVLIVPVGAVAAFVSYLHQHHLMVLAGEPGAAQGFGPLAVDGMLFGMTATLIVTRLKKITSVDEVLDRWIPSFPEEVLQEWSQEVAPISPAPIPVSAPPVSRTRSSWDARKVVEMILDGEKDKEITETTGIGRSTLGRYRKVLRILQNDPRADISPLEKVRPEHVSMIRELVSK